MEMIMKVSKKLISAIVGGTILLGTAQSGQAVIGTVASGGLLGFGIGLGVTAALAGGWDFKDNGASKKTTVAAVLAAVGFVLLDENGNASFAEMTEEHANKLGASETDRLNWNADLDTINAANELASAAESREEAMQIVEDHKSEMCASTYALLTK